MVKLKASSIYESVIAIAIISITITVATYIFVNIMSSQRSVSYYQMIEKINELKNDCIDNQQFKNNTITFKEYSINKIVKNYKDNPKLKWVKFKVSKSKNIIKEYNYLILKE